MDSIQCNISYVYKPFRTPKTSIKGGLSTKYQIEDQFVSHYDSFVAQRVESLVVEAERKKPYIQSRIAIRDVIDETKKTLLPDELDNLIAAIRSTDIPIFEYIYHTGLTDGIWLSEKIEQLKNRYR